MAIKIPQTRIRKSLGMSTVVGWDFSKSVSVETKAATTELDLSAKKVLPSHVVISDGAQGGTDVLLPSAVLHDGRSVIVINDDAAETVDVGGVTCAAVAMTVIYSDGTNWVKLYSVAIT